MGHRLRADDKFQPVLPDSCRLASGSWRPARCPTLHDLDAACSVGCSTRWAGGTTTSCVSGSAWASSSLPCLASPPSSSSRVSCGRLSSGQTRCLNPSLFHAAATGSCPHPHRGPTVVARHGWQATTSGGGGSPSWMLSMAIPGLTVPWSHGIYLWLATAVSISVHEARPPLATSHTPSPASKHRRQPASGSYR